MADGSQSPELLIHPVDQNSKTEDFETNQNLAEVTSLYQREAQSGRSRQQEPASATTR